MKRFLRFISALLVAITALSAVSCNSVAKLEDSGKENAEGITVKSEMTTAIIHLTLTKLIPMQPIQRP